MQQPRTSTYVEKSRYENYFEAELKKLNPFQRKAVEHIEGPVLVIAGPGTGKTQILAARIGYILKSKEAHAGPHNILCLTYTDAGAIAMRQRLLQFIGPTAHRVNIYTFHSFCNEIIQHNLDYFGKREMEPISELENVQLLRHLIDSLQPAHPLKRLKGDVYYDVPLLNNLFAMMKEEGWTTGYVNRMADEYLKSLPSREDYIYKTSNNKQGYKKGDVKQKAIDGQKEKMEKLCAAAGIFEKYKELMLERKRYDYSDMLLWTLNKFKEDVDFLRNYQEWYQYFLVDEYQDTSGAQNELLQMLIDYWDKPNVFAVGDDDQCIYEFQGARVKNMVGFFAKYEKDIEVIVLEENYRSTQIILDAAKSVIENNMQRLVNEKSLLEKIPKLTKTLSAANEEAARSKAKPSIIQYHNILHEEASVVEAIEKLNGAGIPLNEIAVIYYRHRQADKIIEMLQKKSIPYQVKKKINILNLPVIRQILNILRYLQAEHEKPYSGEYILFEIMHYRFFGIHPDDTAKISACCGRKHFPWRECIANRGELMKLNLNNSDVILRFSEIITDWITDVSNLTLPMIVEKVLNRSGLLKFILDSPGKMWNLQVVNTFFDFVKGESAGNPKLTLQKFLEMTGQMEEEGISLDINKTVYEENGVNFITCHSAKGLEFRHVFLIGCTTDYWEKSRGGTNRYSLPDTLTFAMQEDENKIEACRRLFYVAMTRAKEHLRISYAKHNNDGKENERTRFIDEIAEKTNLPTEEKYLPEAKLGEFLAIGLSANTFPVIELPERNFIDSLLENYALSASHLNKYLQCPVTFYYENILKVPAAKNESMAFGNAVHHALKQLFDKMKTSPQRQFPPLQEFIRDFKAQMFKEEDAFTRIQFDRRMALGEKVLPGYYGNYANTWNKVVVTEFNINNIEIAGVPVKGFIDKIEFNGKEANVVDYKTGKIEYAREKLSPPSEKYPLGGDYWRQMVFYRLLMDNNKRKDWKMISGEFDFIEKDDKMKEFVKIKLIISKEEIAFVTNQMVEVYGKIMNHEFSKGCGKVRGTVKDEREICPWCEFVKNNLAEVPVVAEHNDA